jgi:hypothetical protein
LQVLLDVLVSLVLLLLGLVLLLLWDWDLVQGSILVRVILVHVVCVDLVWASTERGMLLLVLLRLALVLHSADVVEQVGVAWVACLDIV